ncbi:capsule biosynthesis protein [Sphingomonas fennica]|uniref:Capsular biosynthesis protein n=1 Tax=Edaphosphingomonas fennica TaxID=114404 RepID=A0A2T4HLT7_9SPHN|nr:capsular biosynthesis protein [Sphingomonas fennica]PTD16749.1 capsular biosynthesis protein [Sphingomonas fennica]
MITPLGRQRRFVFLQGPPGPLFFMLGEEMAARGWEVHRINLNGGDRGDWPGPATDYRGAHAEWPLFFDRFLRDHRITDVLLFGDCRPMHRAAHGMAKLRNIPTHVLEEGYIRPDWMTLERDGVNGHSTLSRDAEWFLAEARTLPPLPSLPPITASFRRRVRDSYRYYHHVVTGQLRFPYYRAHRPGSIIVEGFGWVRKYFRRHRRARDAEGALQRIAGTDYFLFPLQLSSDYQIRAHSPFADMQTAVDYVIESFVRHAPAGSRLLVKEHPLYSGFLDWKKYLRRRARAFGVDDRILHIDGGDLGMLSAGSRGMICANSTSATMALAAGTPVIVLGRAIYDIAGITHQGPLDQFWTKPQPPDPEIYDAFRRVLHDRCLVRGGLASKSATDTLVSSIIERLLTEDRWKHKEPAIAKLLPAVHRAI